ncbi:MAG: hypothetical protein IJP75_06485 [Bacteroidaceae bacterium]|nr:hypothetical protein [Bacteroidaceae bacterium]
MNKTSSRILQLRDAIEKKTGRYPATPKDFDCLAADIYEQLHESVSASTLKRVWGYVDSDSTPRITTLNVLAKFIGYSNWHDFCNSMDDEGRGMKDGATAGTMQEVDSAKEEREVLGSDESDKEKSTHHKGRWMIGLVTSAIVLLLLLGGLKLWQPSHEQSGLVLEAGQVFGQPEDYLPLFGITPSDHSWDELLPHHQGIVVWSPWYRHPNWHNEGNPDSLFPTITEYWTPTEEEVDSVPQSLVRQRNENLFFTVTRTNELRITFMRGIAVGDSATFLGVYRLDRNQSDSTHLVWQRIATQCDLRCLEYLEELKN